MKSLKLLKQNFGKIKSKLMKAWISKSGIEIGREVRFKGFPEIEMRDYSKILIGDHCLVISQSRHTALGVSRPVILRTLLSGAEIIIGNDVGLSGTTIAAAYRISIGSNCLIGSDVMICDTDFHPTNSTDRRYKDIPSPHPKDEVKIGDNVFIGARSIILKGVKIGNGTVVGAGSVVTKSFGENLVIAGNPATEIKRILHK